MTVNPEFVCETIRSMVSEQQVEVVRKHLSEQFARPQRGRLTGAKQWIVVFLLLVAVGAMYVAFHPWGFFLGGSFHTLPIWTGCGKMHSSQAGDYFLYVEIWPSTKALETIIPHTFVRGKAWLCTPKGEHYYLNLSGEMRPRIYLNTVGEPIELDMWNWRGPMPVGRQLRPSFSIWGSWGSGEITGDDRQSLSKNFLPDGGVRPQNTYATPAQMEDVRVTLHEGSHSQWESACRISSTLNPGSR